ncbi:MAG TPA: serine hydrolase [Opitutaceae bacterium]|nr:serine hydrolase [Opitutaceae bacterium]
MSATPSTGSTARESKRARQHGRSRRSSVRGLVLTAIVGVAAAAGARADETDDYIAAQMSRQHIPGLSLAVLKDGKPLKVQGYGLANLELGTHATPETVFQIGSVSKQFIAAGIALLSEAGKVGLDDPVRKYLEDAPETWQAITVRHLLTHTSGLIRETPGLQLKVQSEIDAIRAAYSAPLAFAPGEKWQYSNLGYFVLAEIISRATQIPWPQYLQERIFAPLGMRATRTTTVEELVPHRATGYHWMDSSKYQNAQIVPGVRPSGAFLSSVLDLAKWNAALHADTLFSSQQRELLWTPVKLNDGSEKPYGFGWELGKAGKHRQVKHAGTMIGFRSHMLLFPDDGLTVVVLTNATQAVPEKIAAGVAALYLPDLKLQQPKRNPTNLSAEILEGYTGRYQLPGNRVLTVARREGKLTVAMAMALPGLSKEVAALAEGVSMDIALLTPEDGARFFDEDDSRSTYLFSMDVQGTAQLVIEDPNGKQGQPLPKLAPLKALGPASPR